MPLVQKATLLLPCIGCRTATGTTTAAPPTASGSQSRATSVDSENSSHSGAWRSRTLDQWRGMWGEDPENDHWQPKKTSPSTVDAQHDQLFSSGELESTPQPTRSADCGWKSTLRTSLIFTVLCSGTAMPDTIEGSHSTVTVASVRSRLKQCRNALLELDVEEV